MSATAGQASATVTGRAADRRRRRRATRSRRTSARRRRQSTTVTGSPPATSATITGLTSGTSYTFTVQASNSAGTGPVSAQSNAVTPTGATAPSAPTNVSAAGAGRAQALVTWTAPASNGGSPITGYTVTPYIGANAQTPVQVGALGDLGDGHRARQRDHLHVHGHGDQCDRDRARRRRPRTRSPRRTRSSTSRPRRLTVDSGDTTAVELGVKFTSDTSRDRHRRSASTRPPPTPAPTSGSLWTASGTLLASATFTNETASGWQQVIFSQPGRRSTPNTTYVAGYFAPNGHYSDTASGLRHRRRQQPAAPRARQRHQRQRRVCLQPDQHLPDQHLQRRPTTGSTSTSARRLRCARAGDRRDGDRRAGSATVTLERAVQRRRRRPATRSRPTSARPRRPTTTVTGSPPPTDDDRHRADRGHDVHVHGAGVQLRTAPGRPRLSRTRSRRRRRRRRRLRPGCSAAARRAQALVSWTRAGQQRRQLDHRLHGDAVHRHRPPRRPSRSRVGDLGDGHRAHQRDELHVHGHGHQRDRHQPGLDRVQRGGAPSDTIFDFATPATSRLGRPTPRSSSA